MVGRRKLSNPSVLTFIRIMLGNLFLQKVTLPFVRLWIGVSLLESGMVLLKVVLGETW